MNDLDKILQLLWEYKDNPCDSNFVFRKLFPNSNEGKVKQMILEIVKRQPQLLATYGDENGQEPRAFCAKDLIPEFLENGGFAKLDRKAETQAKYLKEKERIAFEKSKIDLELAQKMLEEYPITKWTARIGLIIGIILAILEVIRWIMSP